jgi:thiamine kinase-like enzyme
MDISKIVKTEIAPKLGLNSTDIRIELRKPIDFQSNCLYDMYVEGKHYIAKKYLIPDELEAAPLREYKALQLLFSLDIAPKPVFYDPSIGPIVLYEYMEGKMWDRQPASAKELNKLVRIWLKINAVQADWVFHGYERLLHNIENEFSSQIKVYLEWTKSEYDTGQRAAEMCWELFESRRSIFQELSENEPTLCFCRADPRFANVIQRPDGRLGLVDWEDSGLRDPAMELADILTHPNQEDMVNWNEWQVFVEPFLDFHLRLDSNTAARYQLYLAVFPVFWLTAILKRGIYLASTGKLRDWTVNGLPGNERLRRYLARGLAWPDMDFQYVLSGIEGVQFFPDGSI